MAPSLPSCISSTFCSHRQASWFLLATLTPFFLPFFILSLPFLLLFLAPVSCFLFFLLLLYKLQVFMRSKRVRSHRRSDKTALNEGYQEIQPIAAAERLDIPLEEDREGRRYGVSPAFEDVEGLNVKSAESHTHHNEGDTEGLCIPPSSARDFEEEKREDIDEELAAQDDTTEDKLEEKQEEQDIIEGPFSEDREERIGGEFPEGKGPELSNVQNVESPVSYKAALEEGLRAPVSHSPERESNFPEETREDMGSPVSYKAALEEGLRHSPERERNFPEETQEDMGEELLRDDTMEVNKQEEDDITGEAIDSEDKQKHFPLLVDAISSHTSVDESQTSLPPTYERESLDAPYDYDHQSNVPFDRQGQESLEDPNERLESSDMHPLEESWRELPAIKTAEPDFQAKMAVLPKQSTEKPWGDALKGQLEVDTPFTEMETQENIGEEPERSSEEDSSLQNLGYEGMLDQKEGMFLPAESFESEVKEGELPEGHGQGTEEAFPKEMRDDVQPQKGGPAKNLAASFEAESLAEQEEGHPSEATSSAVPPPHVTQGGIEYQDRIQEEQKIMADLNVIKKIVGYQAEPHASIMEQIRALYMFLGMERYYWAAEVDEFERALAEIELLKVVVGVK